MFPVFVVLCVIANAVSTLYIPNPNETALMARYIMHSSDWISIATLSTLNGIYGYPFVNLKSVADGPANNGTGMPYLLMNDMDLSGKDVMVNNSITIMATLADTYCKTEHYDPQDPRCGRLLITGKMLKVTPKTEEHDFAKHALLSRHPSMKEWLLVHKFYIAKTDIELIGLLDQFGGVKFIDVKDYFGAQYQTFFERSEIGVTVIKE